MPRVKISDTFSTATVQKVSLKGSIESATVNVDNDGYIHFNNISYSNNYD